MDPTVIAELLTLIALLTATERYSVLIHRRQAKRMAERQRRLEEEAGLRGLFRVFLADR